MKLGKTNSTRVKNVKLINQLSLKITLNCMFTF